MKAVQAIYENGEVIFPFKRPDDKGPIAILVIFPDDPVDALDWEVDEWLESEMEVPY